MYQQMALVASGVSFAWSRFNAEEILTQDQIVIQAHDEMQPLNESGEVILLLLIFETAGPALLHRKFFCFNYRAHSLIQVLFEYHNPSNVVKVAKIWCEIFPIFITCER